MFDRKKYKNFAKVQLKSRWGIPIIMSIIVLAVDFIFKLPGFVALSQSEDLWYFLNNPDASFESIAELSAIINSSTPYITSIIQTVVTAVFTIAALNVYFKMSMSPEPVSFSSFLEGLNNWGRAILAFLWKYLWVTIWTFLTVFLFCIPAIMKMYSYSMMYYIVAEHKEVSIPKALRISMIITKGHKWDLFLLDLSFLGWAILASIPAGLGFVVLTPYMTMTEVNTYHALLQEAMESGRIKPEDFTE